LADAAVQMSLGLTELAQALEQVDAELLDIVRSAVGQRMFGMVPGSLNRVELRGVGGQALQMQARVACAQGRQVGFRAGCVDGRAVPDHDDLSAKMLEQVPEKVVDLLVRDILRMQTEVETQAPALGADRQSADDGYACVVVPVTHDRGLSDGCPGAPDGRDQHEAGFVDEDDVGTQPRSVFFTRGQSRRFHCSMRFSSRSMARRSGFWQLKPRSCRSRATWLR